MRDSSCGADCIIAEQKDFGMLLLLSNCFLNKNTQFFNLCCNTGFFCYNKRFETQ